MSDDDDGSPRGKLQGRYANYFSIGHNAFEFVLDFGQSYETDDAQSQPEVDMHTRIITSPPSARALSQMLHESLDEYERTFVRPPEEPERERDGS